MTSSALPLATGKFPHMTLFDKGASTYCSTLSNCCLSGSLCYPASILPFHSSSSCLSHRHANCGTLISYVNTSWCTACLKLGASRSRCYNGRHLEERIRGKSPESANRSQAMGSRLGKDTRRKETGERGYKEQPGHRYALQPSSQPTAAPAKAPKKPKSIKTTTSFAIS